MDTSPVKVDDQRDASVGFTVALHPLPIINISDHLTRSIIRQGNNHVRIVGALLGLQEGRQIEIQTTIELILQGNDQIDHEFLRSRQAQFKQVFPTFELLGWYSNGLTPTHSDLAIHSQLLEYNESLLFLQISPTQENIQKAHASGELPINVYETILELGQQQQDSQVSSMQKQQHAKIHFAHVKYNIETGEAERIAVDHASKPPINDENDQSSTLVANFQTQYNAIKMFYDRIEMLVEYVKGVQKGTLPRDEEILRQISSLISGLPASSGLEEFNNEFSNEYNDLLLTTYLSDLTNGLGGLNEVVDKFDVVQSNADDGLGGLPGIGGERRSGKGAGRGRGAPRIGGGGSFRQ